MIPTSLKNLLFFFVSTLFLRFLFGSFFLSRRIITGAGPTQHGLRLSAHILVDGILHVESHQHGQHGSHGTDQNGRMNGFLFLFFRLLNSSLLTETGRLGEPGGLRRFGLSLGLSRGISLGHLYRGSGQVRLGRSFRRSRCRRSCGSCRSGGCDRSAGAFRRSPQRNSHGCTSGTGSRRRSRTRGRRRHGCTGSHRTRGRRRHGSTGSHGARGRRRHRSAGSHGTRSRRRHRSTGSCGTRRHRCTGSGRTRGHGSTRTGSCRGNRTRSRRRNGARSRGRYGRCAHNIRSVKSATAFADFFLYCTFFSLLQAENTSRLIFFAENIPNPYLGFFPSTASGRIPH